MIRLASENLEGKAYRSGILVATIIDKFTRTNMANKLFF